MYCLFCVVLCILCVYMCTVLLPPGGYPIAVKYIISYKDNSLGSHRRQNLKSQNFDSKSSSLSDVKMKTLTRFKNNATDVFEVMKLTHTNTHTVIPRLTSDPANEFFG